MSYMQNSENEKIEVATVQKGDFIGQKVLVIHCEHTGIAAPHLLDKSTVEYLLKELIELKKTYSN
jgi:hypothetical protein